MTGTEEVRISYKASRVLLALVLNTGKATSLKELALLAWMSKSETEEGLAELQTVGLIGKPTTDTPAIAAPNEPEWREFA